VPQPALRGSQRLEGNKLAIYVPAPLELNAVGSEAIRGFERQLHLRVEFARAAEESVPCNRTYSVFRHLGQLTSHGHGPQHVWDLIVLLPQSYEMMDRISFFLLRGRSLVCIGVTGAATSVYTNALLYSAKYERRG
jgi:hypothetical protein